MKVVQITSIAALLLLIGTMVPAYAQPDRRREEQRDAEAQQNRRQQEAAPQRQRAQQPQQQQRVQQPQYQRQQQRVQQPQQQRQQQRQQQARQQQQPQRTRQQAVAWQQQRGWARQGSFQGYNTWQQGRAQQWDRQHRTWLQRGGYGGYYIPQSTFSLSFGSRNYFRLSNRPSMYMGYPRFRYGGYSFLLLDPWPEYWQESWYGTDDVYIDYDDGYYLHNRSYPNVRLAITVVL